MAGSTAADSALSRVDDPGDDREVLPEPPGMERDRRRLHDVSEAGRKACHDPPNTFLTTNQTFAGRSARRRMYQGNQCVP